jgi:hypothetical protein
MKYDIEIGSRVMVIIRRSIKFGSGIQMLIGEGDTRTYRQDRARIRLLLFFQNNGNKLKQIVGSVAKYFNLISQN